MALPAMRETFIFDRTDRMSDILYGVAAAHGLIEYERLAHRIGMQANHMTRLLAEVSKTSVAEGGPMWTALCVSADTRRPQSQFHKLARKLRPQYAELTDEELWQAERQRCYAADGRSRRRPGARPSLPRRAGRLRETQQSGTCF
jgi:hypothetical protein